MLHGSPCPERAHGPWNSMEVVCVLSKTLINIPKHLSPHQVFEIPPPLAFPSSLWIQTLSCYSSQKSLHDLKAKIPLHFHDLQLAPRGSDWKAQFPLTWLHISLLHPIFPEPPQYVLGTFSILLFWLHPSGASCILPFVDQPLTSPPALGTWTHKLCTTPGLIHILSLGSSCQSLPQTFRMQQDFGRKMYCISAFLYPLSVFFLYFQLPEAGIYTPSGLKSLEQSYGIY